jgi:hypothetical protein
VNDWETFLARRDELVRAFATVVAAGVARVDTAHPAFHGCYDWHSAVHGTYALLAASRLTGESTFAEIALSQAGPVAVAAEVTALAGGRLDHEVPYGLAWALVLDAEAVRSDVDVFADLAVAAADRVIDHLDALRNGGDLNSAAFDAEYPSATWATIALRRWGLARGNTYAIDTADRAAARILCAFSDGGCEPATARAGRGFFSPVHLAVLLAADLGGGSGPTVLDGRAGFDTDLLVDAQQPTVHSAGLNFTRAWGLYGAWRITQDPRWRDAAAELIIGHAARPERWRDDYARYAHWIPQFGVFAVAETVDRP